MIVWNDGESSYAFAPAGETFEGFAILEKKEMPFSGILLTGLPVFFSKGEQQFPLIVPKKGWLVFLFKPAHFSDLIIYAIKTDA